VCAKRARTSCCAGGDEQVVADDGEFARVGTERQRRRQDDVAVAHDVDIERAEARARMFGQGQQSHRDVEAEHVASHDDHCGLARQRRRGRRRERGSVQHRRDARREAGSGTTT
jgi:hypothetical protein